MRADAIRNRERLLDAARRLFDARGVRAVSTADVAREAGVAKGTVFHHFGDRAGLAAALLDRSERELQEAILRGPPPLGPGADPRERLRAFVVALAEHVDRDRALLIEVDSSRPAGRYRTGAYAGWLQHCGMLLEQIRPGEDPYLLAHVVLSPLAADLAEHLRTDAGRSLPELASTLTGVLDRIAGSPASRPG